MIQKTLFSVSLIVLVLGGGSSFADAQSEMIKSAESAASKTVAGGASVYAMGADGKMQTLRKGTNGYWCMPDDPSTPSVDPMCGDANSMAWAVAWMNKTEPPKGKVGLIFMLAGGSDASNTDPYATGATNDNHWIKTGPHIMILNAIDMMAGYPTGADPDTSMPYVMWAGTPYAHLMVPIN